MYASFFDELEKIAETETKKSNLKRNLAIGGALAGATLLGLGAAKFKKVRAAAAAAKNKGPVGSFAGKTAPKSPPKTPPKPPPSASATDDAYEAYNDFKNKVNKTAKLHKEYTEAGGPRARGKGDLWKRYSGAINDLFSDTPKSKRGVGSRLHEYHQEHEAFKKADILRGGKP